MQFFLFSGKEDYSTSCNVKKKQNKNIQQKAKKANPEYSDYPVVLTVR